MHRRPRFFSVPPLAHTLALAWAAWLPLVGLRFQGGEDALLGQSFWSVELVIGFGLPGTSP